MGQKIMGLIAATFLFTGLHVALAENTNSKIVGSWAVFKDDDRPKVSVPREVMNFWASGKMSITGDHPNEGLYRINGNHLEMLIKNGERAIPVNRNFELSEKELKFKNEKVGWVYYKRQSSQPEGKEPDLK